MYYIKFTVVDFWERDWLGNWYIAYTLIIKSVTLIPTAMMKAIEAVTRKRYRPIQLNSTYG